jgi:hypothetical protein
MKDKGTGIVSLKVSVNKYVNLVDGRLSYGQAVVGATTLAKRS